MPIEAVVSRSRYLTSRLGVAAVTGLQGDNHDPLSYLEQNKVSCVVKHYLAYGHAEQGGIDGGPATLDEQTLRERYMPPWKALVDRGMLRGIMASQSAVNHIPMHCHKRLITGVLRRELNASNVFVHSDGGCVIGCINEPYRLASSQAGAAKLAIGAGVDMDFAGCSYTWLQPEIEAGRIPMSDLDRAVANVSLSLPPSLSFPLPHLSLSSCIGHRFCSSSLRRGCSMSMSTLAPPCTRS